MVSLNGTIVGLKFERYAEVFCFFPVMHKYCFLTYLCIFTYAAKSKYGIEQNMNKVSYLEYNHGHLNKLQVDWCKHGRNYAVYSPAEFEK